MTMSLPDALASVDRSLTAGLSLPVDRDAALALRDRARATIGHDEALATLRRTLEAFHAERTREVDDEGVRFEIVTVARLALPDLTAALTALGELERAAQVAR